MLEYSPSQQHIPEILTAIVVGDVRVGKTTLVRKVCRMGDQRKVVPTIGIEFGAMDLEHRGKQFRVKFWDLCKGFGYVAGQKKYQRLFESYIDRCNIAIIVFDLTNFQTFHNAKQWISEISSKHEDIHLILFGNKKDLSQKNPKSTTGVPKQAITTYIEQTGLIYEEGCALSDDKLVEALRKIIQRNFLPNQLILEGANQAKNCGCFCR